MLQLPLPVSIIGDKPEMEVQDSKIDEEQKQCDDKVNLECSQNDLEDGELEEPGEILDDQIYEQTSGDSINLKLDYNALHEATHENVNTNVTENAQSKQSDSDDSESVASEMDLGLDSDSDIDNIPVKVQDREKLLLAIDETENMDAAKDPIRSKNEMDLPPVEPIDVVIPEDAILLPIGSIVSKVGDTILVEAFESGEEKVLDIDSVLVFEDKTILGKISDTFGPVLQPFYSIRKNLEDLEKLDLVIGMIL
ncbi:hypothetical protein HDV02_005813 [Globomyces sp. JEL0801]|nr:hypothetical protein HDV02_005813 [Globomyces sp. JEL0801]